LVNIEPDLMCVACHKPLELADTPQAVDERAYISWLIAKGETKAQVENNLVRQYGPTVLTKNRTRR
jgi:cytochrome c-type biogenesis protein CcmH/NrfF